MSPIERKQNASFTVAPRVAHPTTSSHLRQGDVTALRFVRLPSSNRDAILLAGHAVALAARPPCSARPGRVLRELLEETELLPQRRLGGTRAPREDAGGAEPGASRAPEWGLRRGRVRERTGPTRQSPAGAGAGLLRPRPHAL